MQNRPRHVRNDLVRGPVRDAQFGEHPVADEISLYDLWNVLVRRRLLIGAALLLAALAGLALAFLSAPRYEYRSGVYIGSVYRGEEVSGDRYRLVELPEAAEARLVDVIVPGVLGARRADGLQAPHVAVRARSGGNSLLLVSLGTEEQRGQIAQLHTAIAERLAEQQLPMFERELALVLRQLQVREAALDEHVQSLREQIDLLAERQYDSSADVGIVALIDAQRFSDLRSELVEARGQLARARAAIEGVQQASRSTQLSFVGSRSEDPVGTRRSVMLALALVLGLFGGICLAFVAEFLANARHKRA